MKLLSRLLLPALLLVAAPALAGEPDPAAQYKAIQEAGKVNSEGNRIDMLAPLEAAKLQAETVKLIAEAYKLVTEGQLNEARVLQVMAEIDQLKQRMRIREYEFQRIVAADFAMNSEIALVEEHENLVRPLVLGLASWKTWVGLEFLMTTTADADIIIAVMFDIPVPALPSSEFRQNGMSMAAPEFPGGNLGELYTFAQDNDLSFKKFGQSHKYIMRVLAMISKAAELRVDELRDINQAIRLTIANII